MKISDNTHVNGNVNMFENNSKSKGNSSKDVDGQTKMGSRAQILIKNSPKRKVAITGDSMIKYLRRGNLSANNNEVKKAAN